MASLHVMQLGGVSNSLSQGTIENAAVFLVKVELAGLDILGRWFQKGVQWEKKENMPILSTKVRARELAK